jgi:effector-binding domain-containing protein
MAPELVELEPQPAVVVRLHVLIGSLGSERGRALPALHRRVLEAGGLPAGRPFSRYIRFVGDGRLEVEAGFPVLESVALEPDAISIVLPGGPTATVSHVGPYESLSATHAGLDDWLEATQRQPGGPRWEVYLTDSGTERDPARWITRIFQPLAVG